MVGISGSYAQKRKSFLGVGSGAEVSLNYKYYLSPKNSIEVQGAYNYIRDGFALSAVYQRHISISKWTTFYFGGGIGIAPLYISKDINTNYFPVSLAPTVGLEMNLGDYDSPLLFVIDYKPNINLTAMSLTQWELVSIKFLFPL